MEERKKDSRAKGIFGRSRRESGGAKVREVRRKETRAKKLQEQR